MNKAYLVLEDGTLFEGRAFGHEGEAMGEAVFNTSMSGYQEILTDPSYTGQIVAMTYPMIGNYGVNDEDVESPRVQAAGLVVREYCKTPSNFRATRTLDRYLKDEKVPAIEGVDTRKLTLHLRTRGAMRAGIFADPKGSVDRLLSHPSMLGLDLASGVSCKEPYAYGKGSGPKIAVYDYGVKLNILRLLEAQGFAITVYPGTTPLAHVLSDGARGVFLSNGPGDPDAVHYARQLVRDMLAQGVPSFGICLGHQLMGLGLGAKTFKLKFGHRGGNQPVKNLRTGRVEITSQNHGFAVDYESLGSNRDVEITHINLNDNTVEGLRHRSAPFFSVQYHPEACPGPHDSSYLFGEFHDLVVKAGAA